MKKTSYGKHSPVARVLSDRLWRQRIKPSKKIYDRKKDKAAMKRPYCYSTFSRDDDKKFYRHQSSSYPGHTV